MSEMSDADVAVLQRKGCAAHNVVPLMLSARGGLRPKPCLHPSRPSSSPSPSPHTGDCLPPPRPQRECSVVARPKGGACVLRA